MIEYLLIKVITNPFNSNVKFCEYYQVLREDVGSNSIEYRYYNTNALFRPFKKRLPRYTANAILSFLSYNASAYIAKNDDEYLNQCFCYGYATIVYKYTI